ncbi:MAG: hypothetical protein LBK61_06305 [Spirochaetaceae bacterium]|jgi:hypothetical protein|nr:hypothetical protein [Spirochaetaceae bacterium]
MAKTVYNDDDLRATRARLDVKDDKEAKFMMKVLGGEVGEVGHEKPAAPQGRKREYTKSTPMRHIETAELDEKEGDSAARVPQLFSEGLSYRERVKMDAQEASADFKIKTWFQAFCSKLGFFYTPQDVVCRVFVIIKMEDYFLPLNKLVNKVRLIFPRNNTGRSRKLKLEYPFAFSVLDTIRYWNIEKISSLLARLQSHPRTVVVSDFAGIIREFYRPLILFEMLESKNHITKAVNDLDFMLQDESDNQIKRNTAEEIVSLFDKVNEDVRYQLYPFLLKNTSRMFVPYENFFSVCETNIRSFLGIQPNEIIQPQMGDSHYSSDTAAVPKEEASEEPLTDEDLLIGLSASGEDNPVAHVSRNDIPRAVQRGLDVLEQLFPEAGWDRLDTFPDIYQYFAKSLSLKKNADVIDPENPMLQGLVLMQILDELFYGFRSIRFVGAGFDLDEFLGIIDEWHKLIDNCFERTYLPRLTEFVKLFYNPLEPRQKTYAAKLREELNWQARLYLFPSLKMDSFAQPTIHKKDITAIFPKVRVLRHSFTVIAGEIETALHSGGASALAECAAISNPWDKYVFQVSNPLSKRLNSLLGKESRTNVSLIYYAISVLSVLDYLINNPNSWAYQANTAKLFRSSDTNGIFPESPPERHIDADEIFRRSIEKLKMQRAQNNKSTNPNGQS